MCTFSDVAFVHFCVTIETPKEHQGFWLCLGLAGRLGWLAGVAPTVEKPKENQGFWPQTLKNLRKINVSDYKPGLAGGA